MEQVKKTYQEVIEFYNSANRYMQSHTENNKFNYALARTHKSAGRVFGAYKDRVGDLEVKHCLAADDGKGEILRDERGKMKFTKEGLLKCSEEQVALFTTEVPLDVHFAAEVPDDLSLVDRECFTGFVIRNGSTPE